MDRHQNDSESKLIELKAHSWRLLLIKFVHASQNKMGKFYHPICRRMVPMWKIVISLGLDE